MSWLTDNSIFSLKWVGVAVAVGLALQAASWVVLPGIFSGWSAYIVLGAIVGVLSPGRTIAEPAAGAFVLAALGFVVNNLLMSVLGVGLVMAAAYGVGGIVLAIVGAVIGEKTQDLA